MTMPNDKLVYKQGEEGKKGTLNGKEVLFTAKVAGENHQYCLVLNREGYPYMGATFYLVDPNAVDNAATSLELNATLLELDATLKPGTTLKSDTKLGDAFKEGNPSVSIGFPTFAKIVEANKGKLGKKFFQDLFPYGESRAQRKRWKEALESSSPQKGYKEDNKEKVGPLKSDSPLLDSDLSSQQNDKKVDAREAEKVGNELEISNEDSERILEVETLIKKISELEIKAQERFLYAQALIEKFNKFNDEEKSEVGEVNVLYTKLAIEEFNELEAEAQGNILKARDLIEKIDKVNAESLIKKIDELETRAHEQLSEVQALEKGKDNEVVPEKVEEEVVQTSVSSEPDSPQEDKILEANASSENSINLQNLIQIDDTPECTIKFGETSYLLADTEEGKSQLTPILGEIDSCNYEADKDIFKEITKIELDDLMEDGKPGIVNLDLSSEEFVKHLTEKLAAKNDESFSISQEKAETPSLENEVEEQSKVKECTIKFGETAYLLADTEEGKSQLTPILGEIDSCNYEADKDIFKEITKIELDDLMEDGKPGIVNLNLSSEEFVKHLTEKLAAKNDESASRNQEKAENPSPENGVKEQSKTKSQEEAENPSPENSIKEQSNDNADLGVNRLRSTEKLTKLAGCLVSDENKWEEKEAFRSPDKIKIEAENEKITNFVFSQNIVIEPLDVGKVTKEQVDQLSKELLKQQVERYGHTLPQEKLNALQDVNSKDYKAAFYAMQLRVAYDQEAGVKDLLAFKEEVSKRVKYADSRKKVKTASMEACQEAFNNGQLKAFLKANATQVTPPENNNLYEFKDGKSGATAFFIPGAGSRSIFSSKKISKENIDHIFSDFNAGDTAVIKNINPKAGKQLIIEALKRGVRVEISYSGKSKEGVKEPLISKAMHKASLIENPPNAGEWVNQLEQLSKEQNGSNSLRTNLVDDNIKMIFNGCYDTPDKKEAGLMELINYQKSKLDAMPNKDSEEYKEAVKHSQRIIKTAQNAAEISDKRLFELTIGALGKDFKVEISKGNKIDNGKVEQVLVELIKLGKEKKTNTEQVYESIIKQDAGGALSKKAEEIRAEAIKATEKAQSSSQSAIRPTM